MITAIKEDTGVLLDPAALTVEEFDAIARIDKLVAATIIQNFITRPDRGVMPIPGATDHNPFPSLFARGQVRNFFDEMTQAFEQGRCLRPYRDWAVRKPRAA